MNLNKAIQKNKKDQQKVDKAISAKRHTKAATVKNKISKESQATIDKIKVASSKDELAKLSRMAHMVLMPTINDFGLATLKNGFGLSKFLRTLYNLDENYKDIVQQVLDHVRIINGIVKGQVILTDRPIRVPSIHYLKKYILGQNVENFRSVNINEVFDNLNYNPQGYINIVSPSSITVEDSLFVPAFDGFCVHFIEFKIHATITILSMETGKTSPVANFKLSKEGFDKMQVNVVTAEKIYGELSVFSVVSSEKLTLGIKSGKYKVSVGVGDHLGIDLSAGCEKEINIGGKYYKFIFDIGVKAELLFSYCYSDFREKKELRFEQRPSKFEEFLNWKLWIIIPLYLLLEILDSFIGDNIPSEALFLLVSKEIKNDFQREVFLTRLELNKPRLEQKPDKS